MHPPSSFNTGEHGTAIESITADEDANTMMEGRLIDPEGN